MSETLKCCGRTATSWWHRTYCNSTLSSKKALPTKSVNRVRGGLTGRRPIEPDQTTRLPGQRSIRQVIRRLPYDVWNGDYS